MGKCYRETEIPCRLCEERSAGCHAVCTAYAEFRKRVDEINEIRKRQLEADKVEAYTRDKLRSLHQSKRSMKE